MARSTDANLATRQAAKPLKTAAPRQLPAVVVRMSTYLREVWIELNRVNWPTRRELTSSTMVVLLVLVALAIYLGIFDYLYTVIIKRWLLRQPVQ